MVKPKSGGAVGSKASSEKPLQEDIEEPRQRKLTGVVNERVEGALVLWLGEHKSLL